MKIVIFDTETTGLPPKTAKYDTDFMQFPYILSMAWKVNNEPTREYIINQEGRKVPAEATAINGITQEMCDASEYTSAHVLYMFLESVMDADLIVGFNIYFDTSTIKANFLRLISQKIMASNLYDDINKALDKDKRIDVMRACHKLWSGKWPTLSEAYTRFFQMDFKAHTAGADVDATHQILQQLVMLNAV